MMIFRTTAVVGAKFPIAATAHDTKSTETRVWGMHRQ